jgi:hypothetical protein
MTDQEIVRNGKTGAPELTFESKVMKTLARITGACVLIAVVLVFSMSLDFQIPELRNITLAAMAIITLFTILLGSLIVFSKREKLKRMENYIALLLCVIFIIAGTNSIKGDIAVKKLIKAQAQIAKLQQYPHHMIIKKRNKIIYYIKGKYKNIPNVVVEKIADEVVSLSDEEGVPVPILIGIVSIESSFNPSAASKKLARGLMQVRWDVWKTDLKKVLELKSQFDLHNVKEGLQAGIYVFKHYMDKNEGDMSLALYDYVGKDRTYVTKVCEAIGDYVAYGGPKDEPEV